MLSRRNFLKSVFAAGVGAVITPSLAPLIAPPVEQIAEALTTGKFSYKMEEVTALLREILEPRIRAMFEADAKGHQILFEDKNARNKNFSSREKRTVNQMASTFTASWTDNKQLEGFL